MKRKVYGALPSDLARAAARPEYVWKFDVNNRVYPPKGGPTSAPIWREHWRKHKIIGENRVSYLLELGDKVSKKACDWSHVFDEAHLDELAWAHDNAHKIARAIAGQGTGAVTVAQLREVARIIGYKETDK